MLINGEIKTQKCRYMCDRCKKEIERKNKKTIYVQDGIWNSKKIYDFCEKCYTSFVRGVEKYSNRVKEEDNLKEE